MLSVKFNAFLEKLTTHAESVDTPFVLFGIYMIANYICDFLWWPFATGHADPSLYIHIFDTILAVALSLKKFWPPHSSKYYVLCWYLAILWWIPLYNTLYWINFPMDSSIFDNSEFVINVLMVLFTMVLVLDWLAFIIILVIGGSLGYFIHEMFYVHVAFPLFKEFRGQIFSFFWILFLSILFSRNSSNNRANALRQKQELANLSAQVAHDIRSPLAALQILTEQQLLELPESKRILLRDAVHQIRDITNNLDQNAIKNEKTITQVAVLLENVLSERRAAFVNKPIEFKENIPLESYGYFSNLIPSEIKRVITNIINNAVEAMSIQGGIVTLNLKKSDDQIVIEIADNGAGIPKETLDALFARGFTTKKTGSGLGLFHAKETLTQLGGNIDMTSEVGKGTTVSLSLPACEPPKWFIDKLEVPDHSILVCVDDSVSIWNVWQERFNGMTHNIELRYCADKEALLAQLREQSEKPYTYLIDYEFSGKLYTGLDLIKLVLKFKKMNDQVYLVTSRSGESNIHQFCRENEVKMIPKFFALRVLVGVV